MRFGNIKRFIKCGINNVLNNINFKYHKVSVERNVVKNGIIKLIGHNKISIGSNCKINSGADYNVIGGDTRTAMVVGGNGFIKIGNNVGISNSTLVSYENGIVIEDNVLLGGNCKIYDTDFHSIDYVDRMAVPDINIKTGRVRIQQGAFIGAHSIILKGVSIGKRSVVGAGSVVTKDIPDDEVWAGNPAKFIKKITGGIAPSYAG